MTKKPTFAVRIADLEASVAFYGGLLGLRVEAHDPDSATATIVDGLGMPVLLAGPQTTDLAPYMGVPQEVAAPGTTLYFYDAELEARMQALAEAGVEGVQLTETRWGERRLVLRDPDGYRVILWMEVPRTPEETLALYAQASGELRSIMEEASEQELDLSNGADGWTIRQIVLHLADTEAMQLPRIKMALAEPGRVWSHNIYSPQAWSDAAGYSGLPVQPAVDLFCSVRAYIGSLLEHLPPDAWDRYTANDQGDKTTVGSIVGMLASHALEHIDEISGIRRLHAGR